MATGKNWRSQNTVWLQVQQWTAKSRRKEICTWYEVCVVTPSTTPMTTWPPRLRAPSTQSAWTSTRELMHAWSHVRINGISPWTSQAKMGLWDFDPIFELQSLSKNVSTASQANKSEEPISPQQNRRWHSSSSDSWCFFFVTVGSVYSRWRSTVTDGWCGQVHFTRHFSHAVCGFNYMHVTLHGSRWGTQRVCVRFIPSSCHPWCVLERPLSVSSCCPSPV